MAGGPLFSSASARNADATPRPEPFPSPPHGVADRRALRNGGGCTIIDEVETDIALAAGDLPGGDNQDTREEGHGRG